VTTPARRSAWPHGSTDMMAGWDIDKDDPADVVRTALDGPAAGALEVIADADSAATNAALSADPNVVYPTSQPPEEYREGPLYQHQLSRGTARGKRAGGSIGSSPTGPRSTTARGRRTTGGSPGRPALKRIYHSCLDASP
jgi:hypothetical protein